MAKTWALWKQATLGYRMGVKTVYHKPGSGYYLSASL